MKLGDLWLANAHKKHKPDLGRNVTLSPASSGMTAGQASCIQTSQNVIQILHGVQIPCNKAQFLN